MLFTPARSAASASDAVWPTSFDLYVSPRGPATTCGDWLEVRETRRGKLVLSIDVSGSMDGNGALAKQTVAYAAQAVAAGLALDRIVDCVKPFFEHHRLDEDQIAAFFVASYDASTRMLQYVSAGHEAALAVWPSGEHLHLGPTTPVFAQCVPSRSACESVRLDADATLCVISDGVTEARDPAGTMYGSRGVLGQLRNARHVRAVDIVRGARFHAGALRDDASACIVRFR